jgi:hypothetical protein
MTNGKIIGVDADTTEWCEKSRTIRLIKHKKGVRVIVARINMDTIVGWIEVDRRGFEELRQVWKDTPKEL